MITVSSIAPSVLHSGFLKRSRVVPFASKTESDGTLRKMDFGSKTDIVARQAVEMLIRTPFLFNPIKAAAKGWMKFLADQKGVPWSKRLTLYQPELLKLEQIYQETVDETVVYPEYYLQPFHAYDDGNLSWMSAFEVESAFEVVLLRACPQAETVEKGRKIFSQNFIQSIVDRVDGEVSNILDIGCGIGVLTELLIQPFPDANIVGIDPSPYFLSLAKLNKPKNAKIEYKHMFGESAGDYFKPNSFDLVCCSFVIHECPTEITKTLVKQAVEFCRPGGLVHFMDINAE